MLARESGVGMLRELRPTTGHGPLGTGLHVLWFRARSSERWVGDVWATVMFLPLVPLGTWELTASTSGVWRLAAIAPPRLAPAVLTVVAFLGATALVFAPAGLAVTVFMGQRLIELGGLLGSVALFTGGLALLDSTRLRLPLRPALAALRAAGERTEAPPAAAEDTGDR